MTTNASSLFFDLAPEPLAVLGVDGRVLQANDAFRYLLGRPGAELVAEGAEGFVHPEDLHCWQSGMASIPNAAGPAAVCVRCRSAAAEWRWVEWTCSSAPDGSIFSVARDVTCQRLDSRRLQQLESQMDAVTAEVWLLDREGRVVQANAYVSTLLGVEERDLIGKRREDVKPGLDSVDVCFEETMKVIETGVPVWRSIEKWTRGSETRYSSVDKVPLRGVDDVVSNVVVLAYEITPQVEAETQFRKLNEQLELRVALRTDELGAANAALRASEERTSSILQNALDAVVMMDREGFVTGWNQAAERVFGYSSSEAIGREVAELIIPREGRAAHRVGLNAAKETGMGPVIGRLIEVTAMRKSGESFPAEISITRMGSGMSMGFTAFVRDISERKDAEIRILDLNHQLGLRVEEAGAANRELEAFCYSVSHDLRTPLRSIDGFSLALLEDYGHVIDATGKDYMVRVRNATQRMAGLIDDLLNLSRVSRAELNREAVDLSTMAAGICAELKLANPGRNVVCEITPGLTVTADPALVRIVLENLIGNAWKYTSRKAEAHIELGMRMEHNREIYYVKDNGAGFDMTYADKLFAPFQRLHRADEFEGTGVGLATVLRILHRHGGHAWAEASVDRGATVFFTL